jgi:hypothetical protein
MLNFICLFLALLGFHPILHVSRIRVKKISEQYHSPHTCHPIFHLHRDVMLRYTGHGHMFNGTVQHLLVLCREIDCIVQESKNKTDDSIDKENEGSQERRERSIGITYRSFCLKSHINMFYLISHIFV